MNSQSELVKRSVEALGDDGRTGDSASGSVGELDTTEDAETMHFGGGASERAGTVGRPGFKQGLEPSRNGGIVPVDSKVAVGPSEWKSPFGSGVTSGVGWPAAAVPSASAGPSERTDEI